MSEGEKLFILANEAGANGDAVKQKECLDKLVAAYPNDERARLSLGNYYFGQQEYEQAIAHYKKATELAPDYSPAYFHGGQTLERLRQIREIPRSK